MTLHGSSRPSDFGAQGRVRRRRVARAEDHVAIGLFAEPLARLACTSISVSTPQPWSLSAVHVLHDGRVRTVEDNCVAGAECTATATVSTCADDIPGTLSRNASRRADSWLVR
jgi:hypothetical protein